MTPRPTSDEPGPLVIIGGAEDKLRGKTILSHFVRLAGGVSSRIAVLSTASALGDEATDIYRELFERLGCRDIRGLRPVTREQANDPDVVATVEQATGVFMTGGNQARLASVVAGTDLGRAILAAHARGAVVGGTSAGASALSSHMVAFGASGDVPKQRMVQLSAGLGLLHDVIVDQHFSERGRLGRLLTAFAANPGLLGIGLDEDTAVLIDRDGTLEVLGSGMVTIVDGRDATSDYYEREVGAVLTVVNSHLSVLGPGRRFDLNARQAMDFGGAGA